MTEPMAERMADSQGDEFTVEANYGEVFVEGDVVDLAFTPTGAMHLASLLIRGASVAMEQNAAR